MTALAGLRWVGGKSARSTTGSGRWINSLLPAPNRGAYYEPFCGMMGILLQRAAAPVEAVADLDGRLMNWWRTVRDQPAQLTARLAEHPHPAPQRYQQAMEQLDEPGLTGAVAFTIAVHWGFGGKIGHMAKSEAFLARPSTTLTSIPINQLAHRVRNVNFHRQDACDFITARLTRPATWYIDPPYPTSKQSYYDQRVEQSTLNDLLPQIQGWAAISGYDHEWDHLGWHRYSRRVSTPLQANGASRRTECLWTNYEPAGHLL